MRRLQRAVFAAIALLTASCGQAAPPGSDSEQNPSPSETAAVGTETPGDERVFCQEVGRRISPADCDVYVELARSAARGVAAFNAPDPMRRGETHTLQLAISFAPPQPTPEEEVARLRRERDAAEAAEAAARQEAERLARERAQQQQSAQTTPAPPPGPPQTPGETVDGLPGETVEFQPLVGRFMRAELTGVGFDITPKSSASQEVTPDSVTTWNWEVVARQSGARALTLRTVVEGCTGTGECVPLRSTTQNYTVNVEVGPVDRVKDFLIATPDWIKIVSAILVALAGLIAAWAGLRNAAKKARGGD